VTVDTVEAWEKDCSDYESDKLNVTDVEPEPAQPAGGPRWRSSLQLFCGSWEDERLPKLLMQLIY